RVETSPIRPISMIMKRLLVDGITRTRKNKLILNEKRRHI
ncbi:MAG: hypothetical protein ACI9NY_001352, partial [Kiritimatiellia bacterium]